VLTMIAFGDDIDDMCAKLKLSARRRRRRLMLISSRRHLSAYQCAGRTQAVLSLPDRPVLPMPSVKRTSRRPGAFVLRETETGDEP
jgi:hypothetical protein